MDAGPDPYAGGTSVMSGRGILIMMAVIVAAVSLLGFVFGGVAFGIGVIFGGGLSFVNYLWLARSTRVMFAENALPETTATLAIKYFLRYAAILCLLLAIFWTNVLPVTAVILGLSAFAFAVVVHGVRSIFSRP